MNFHLVFAFFEKIHAGLTDNLIAIKYPCTEVSPENKMREFSLKIRLTAIVLLLFCFSISTFPNPQADSLLKMGQLQLRQKKFSPAKVTYLKAIKYCKDKGDNGSLIEVMNNIGLLEEEIKQKDSAMRYYRLGLSLAKEIPDSAVAVDLIFNSANLLITLNKYSEAKSLLNKGIRVSGKAGMTDDYIRGRRLMADLLYKQGNYKDAFNQISGLSVFSESISSVRNKELINNLKARYDKELKELKAISDKQNGLKGSLSFVRSSGSICLLVILAILIGMLLMFYYICYKNKESIANLLYETNRQAEKQESELKSVSETKDKFFSIITQDLRTPFTSILGFADILKEEYGRLEEKEKMLYIRAIHSASFNIYELLKNLHDWSRLQSGSLEYKPTAIDIAEMAEQHIQLFTSYSQNKDILLSIDSQGRPIAFADRNMVSAIIRNLLNNAIKFTNKGGEVHVNIQNADNYAELSITDIGVGMSEENLEKLFTSDQTFRSKGTADEAGTGLGLLLCKRFVTINNGCIHAESAPGKGSRFTITLPLKAQEQDQ